MIEYGVIQEISGKEPRHMPITTNSLVNAQDYILWIEERDRAIKVKADEQKAVMDAGGLPDTNRDYMEYYAKRHRPLKDASYTIVKREVSEWERV